MSSGKQNSKYLQYASLGLEIAIGISLPMALGYWLDSYFNTSPWLLLVGCIIGVTNIFLIIFKLKNSLKQ